MNVSATTTGLVPLVIGSVERFTLNPWLNKIPWLLTGGTVTLYVADPNNVLTTFSATIDPTGFSAYFDYTVIGPASVSVDGDVIGEPWRRAWLVVDALGRKQKSRPIAFPVVSSPF